jgi:membrane-associated PAP2 superfamily phosphatase
MQQLRGAHFLTHTLWSLWIALATVFIITLALDLWPERRKHSLHPHANDIESEPNV